jgi:hypothetical protein
MLFAHSRHSANFATMNRDTQEAVRAEIKNFFRQLNTMFGVFLAGVFLFLVSVQIVVFFQGALDPSYRQFLYVGAPLSSVALIIIAQRLAEGRFKGGRGDFKLHEKMDAYRAGAVLRMIVLDGAAFVQLIAYVFTDDKLFLLLALAVVTVFWMSKPNLERFVRDMALNEVEKKVMRDHGY